MSVDYISTVRLNATHIMFAGPNLSGRRANFIYNQETNTTVDLAPMNVDGRFLGTAGLVTFDNGTQIVIIAGGTSRKSAESFNLEEQVWKRNIPDLPVNSELRYPTALQFEKTFLIIGGIDGQESSNSILRYDRATEDWIKLEQTMREKRHGHISIPVSTKHVNCEL